MLNFELKKQIEHLKLSYKNLKLKIQNSIICTQNT